MDFNRIAFTSGRAPWGSVRLLQTIAIIMMRTAPLCNNRHDEDATSGCGARLVTVDGAAGQLENITGTRSCRVGLQEGSKDLTCDSVG